jgi:N-acetylmuramoyl-L-alanine amidase
MKKIVSVSIIILLLISLPIPSFAKELLLQYDGSAHKYSGTVYKLQVNGKTVPCDVPPVVIKKHTLVPVRTAFEGLGATLKWESKTQQFKIVLGKTRIELRANSSSAKLDGKTVKLDAPAKLINDRLFVPAGFFSQNLKMTVGLFPGKGLVTLDNKAVATPGKLNSVKYAMKDNKCEVLVNLDSYKDYKISSLSGPDRIVLDISNVKLADKPLKLNVSSSFVKAIRYSQMDAKTVRVVLDTVGQLKHEILEKKGQLVLTVTGNSTSKPSRGGTVNRGSTDTENLSDIKYTSNADNEEIAIITSEYKGYSIMMTEEPDRILIKIPGADAPTEPRVYNFNGNPVQAAVLSRLDNNTAQIEIHLSARSQYQISEEKDRLVLWIGQATEPSDNETGTPSSNDSNPSGKLKNIVYRNAGDRVCLLLNNTKLTEGGQPLEKFYHETYDDTGKIYTLSFPTGNSDLESGTLQINDNILDSIVVEKILDQTCITFHAKDKFLYNVFSRTELKDTAITLLKPTAPDEQLVVIDPGHGGFDPGAVYAGVQEKDLNLDISLKLNALLREKNIKTYILREDDSFLGLYERANIANSLHAALFISIHNNAYYTSHKGTETLYNYAGSDTGSFNSKKLAQVIQSNLVNTLGTVDRKIVLRPNLVVLKGTTMFAALAEIGFITNVEDRTNLLKDEFRQTSAAALCESILQALSAMNPKS